MTMVNSGLKGLNNEFFNFLVSKETSNFHPFEVVGRGSETQL